MKAPFLAAPILPVLAAFAGVVGCRSAPEPTPPPSPAVTPQPPSAPQTPEPPSDSKPRPPEWVFEQPKTLIEMNAPYTVTTRTIREWLKLGPDDAGRYKNPDTGEDTMTNPITCASCNKQIPPPSYPAAMLAMDPPARDAEMLRIAHAYKCPLCGKSPYPPDQFEGMPPAR